jgi:hypothetical protein
MAIEKRQARCRAQSRDFRLDFSDQEFREGKKLNDATYFCRVTESDSVSEKSSCRQTFLDCRSRALPRCTIASRAPT